MTAKAAAKQRGTESSRDPLHRARVLALYLCMMGMFTARYTFMVFENFCFKSAPGRKMNVYSRALAAA